jgi:hypothetical protein
MSNGCAGAASVFEGGEFEAQLEQELLEHAKRSGQISLTERGKASEDDLLESYNNFK